MLEQTLPYSECTFKVDKQILRELRQGVSISSEGTNSWISLLINWGEGSRDSVITWMISLELSKYGNFNRYETTSKIKSSLV